MIPRRRNEWRRGENKGLLLPKSGVEGARGQHVLVHLPPGAVGIGDRLRVKAEQQYTIPGTLRTRVAAEAHGYLRLSVVGVQQSALVAARG